MKTVVLLLVSTVFQLSVSTSIQAADSPSSKPAAKTYRDPLLLDMADPHVIRVDKMYYLYGTTHTKGYDAFVSNDLVNWTNKGLAFDNPRGGAWAPDVFHDKRGDGKFYLYYTDNIPDA